MPLPSTAKERRKQIEALFLAAVELPEHEQTRFVQGSTPDDAELQAQVLALLNADRQSTAVIGNLAQDLNVGSVLQDSAASALSRAGETWGNYTLTDLIGSGGMGEVWRAERADGRFDSTVAIKLLRADQMGDAALARFEQEGQLLARLVHPNIARLMDAGITEQRRPFLVLELVDGTSIDQYCEAMQLSLNDRLALFLDVLDAIAHAHANLVLHRDIKPANILVTDDGVVKLLDFGVATLLDDNASESGITAAYGAAMTPEYAAPEQLLGDTVTTATDTFALGLVLHVLLAGWHPRRGNDPAPYTLVQAIRHATDELPKASTLPAQSMLSPKTFSGDIDNIIAKAVAADPDERYPTATALADDIRRYLRHEPVVAQAPTLTYRMAKFVRRHRGGVVSAVLVSLALIVATVVTALQSIEAKRQRDNAIYEQQRVQATNEFTSLLFEEMGSEPFTTTELLDRGAQLLEQQYNSQQGFMGRVQYDVAERFGKLDERQRQRALLKSAATVAETQGDLSLLGAINCDLAQLLVLLEPDRAKTMLHDGQLAIDKAKQPNAGDRIACLRATSKFADVDGRFSDAEQALEQANEISNTHGAVPVALQATLLSDLAYLYFNNQRNLDALALLEQVASLYRDNGRGNTRSALKNTSHRAVVLSSTGQLLAGKEAFEQLLLDYEQRNPEDRGIAVTLEQYGITLLRMRKPELALPPLLRARELAEKGGSEVDAAFADLGIARVLVSLNRIPEAEERLAVAAELLERNKNAYLDQSTYRPLLRAQIHTMNGDLQRAWDIVQTHFKEMDYPTSLDGNGLASFLVRAIRISNVQGDHAATERYSTDLLRIAERFAADPDTSADVGFARLYRAQARTSLGQSAQALKDAKAAAQSLASSLGNDHPATQEARQIERSRP
ncbi:MAG: protein kinase [Pseudomonadales bacterium]